MNTRREFFGAAAGAAVALAAGGGEAGAAEPIALRPIFRRQGDRWVRVRMHQLAVGDVFRIGDPEREPDLARLTNRVTAPPSREPDGTVWGVAAVVVPDP